MFRNTGLTKNMWLAAVLAGSIIVPKAISQSPQGTQNPAATKTSPAVLTPYRNQSSRMARRATMYYESVWGVDSLIVKWAESGELVRFSFRVVDAEKAKPLNDKKVEPSLIDPQAGVKLVIPSLEKVGSLRQTSTPEAGKSYWMAFSNSGRRVRRGDHVDVVIGNFRAQGLIVD